MFSSKTIFNFFSMFLTYVTLDLDPNWAKIQDPELMCIWIHVCAGFRVRQCARLSRRLNSSTPSQIVS